MAKPHILPGARLSSIALHLSIEGEAWGGFTAEREVSRRYLPGEWPGLRKAIADLCDWPDCQPGTVRPFYGQLQHNLNNEHGHQQHLSRELPRLEC